MRRKLAAACFFTVLLCAACVTHLGVYQPGGESGEQSFLEIDGGLRVTAFDGQEVDWGLAPEDDRLFFGRYAEVALPSGVHTLFVTATKELSTENGPRIITVVYSVTADVQINFAPGRRYRIEEDAPFLDSLLGAAELIVKVREVSG
ncbi:MAG: hypothetical protein LBQ57_04525 [Spirochaetales bacterium]|jgi:hypothetical protein|nr:hypothetical protein [Spirochaetales bacterium]